MVRSVSVELHNRKPSHLPAASRQRSSVCKDTRRRLSRLSIKRPSRPSTNTSARQANRLSRLSLSIQCPAASSDIVVDTAVVEAGDHVTVHYKASLDDGTVVDDSREREPLEYIVDQGKVIQGLSKAVLGLTVGQKTSRQIPPSEAFGDWRKEMLAEFPVQDVKQDIKVGDGLKLSNGLQATVHKIENGVVTIDANMPLAGKTLTLEIELLRLVKANSFEQATFGAGCFWGPELLFARIPGVLQTEVGYSQGTVENATYEDVCSGLTGHNEVVQVTYDSSIVSYKKLLEEFTNGHNPTQKGGQGGDIGSQYRSGIYTHTPEQKQAAQAHLKEIQSNFKEPLATEVEDLNNYNMAEDYHQQYLSRGGRFGRAQSAKKGCADPIRCYG